jgi:dipeptidyl aminopeptidase/acylaminoacyl peptidase
MAMGMLPRVPISPLRTVILAFSLIGAKSATDAASFAVAATRELDLGTVAAWSPKWSPSGEWIAFSLPKSEGIALVRPDGRKLLMLTTEPRSGYRFAWSPDGREIAYRVAHPEAGPRQYSIEVIDVETGAITPSEIVAEAQPPQWETGADGSRRWASDDGKARVTGEWRWPARMAPAKAAAAPLIITRGGETWMEADGKRKKLCAAVALLPAWNRAGTEVAFGALDRIHVAAAGEAPTARELCVGQHPAWSPDGEWIVFQITRDHSHATGDDRQHTPDTLPHLHNDKTNHQIVDSDLWLIRRDGTERQQLTNTPDVLESDPDWSPDGKSIVCRDERTGRLRILELARP